MSVMAWATAWRTVYAFFGAASGGSIASTAAGSKPCAIRLARIASRVAVASSPLLVFLLRLVARLASCSASRRLARLLAGSSSCGSPSCGAGLVVIGDLSCVAAAPVVPRAAGKVPVSRRCAVARRRRSR
jgi:hypothetical protein